MYLDVKVGMRGEIVIPSFVRKKLKIKPGGSVKMEVTEDSAIIKKPEEEVMASIREFNKKHGVRGKIVTGNRLYEELIDEGLFGR